ncbi:Cys-Gln thioester bond-forming surface protein [Carnobacteriaceae bacterium zg-C25]|nr:Cys-Gln thioester bond-forming surface protein [Carnobacteriaceae bacterium zg-C25]
MKYLKLLFIALLSVFMYRGLTAQMTVDAATVGQLTRGTSQYSGRMEFRYPTATQNTYEDYMILMINGEPVFCLDPRTFAYEGQYVGEEIRDGERITNRTTLDKQLQDKLMLVTYFGYKQNPNHKNYHYTQALVWESINYRAQSFTGGLSMGEYQVWKANVMAKVNGYKNVVSFNNQSATLKVGESVTFVDSYNVLQNLNVPAQQNGYTFLKNGNQLTVTATANAVDGKVGFKQPFNNLIHGASIVFRKPNSQTVASFKIKDPQSGALNLTTIKKGIIELYKTSASNGKAIEGVEFTLYDKATNKALATKTTNGDGWLAFLDLDPDKTYVVKETKTKQGYYLNAQAQEHRLKPAEKFRMDFKNEPVPTVTSNATTEKGEKVGLAFEKHKEVVTSRDLVIGNTYKLVSSQYNVATKTPLATQEKTFKANNTTEVHTFIYDVDENFIGDVVYGAELFKNNQRLVNHTDYNNKAQTVRVVKPNVTTQATTVSGGKVGYAYDDHKEVATMTNLIVGRTYEVVATQYDENGKVYATQKREFTAKNTTHVETFIFKVPVSFVGNIVYGEDLYHEKRKIVTHFDLTNKNQTVTVIEPKVSTQATTVSGGKVGYDYDDHKEVATMTNLIVGRTYEVVATQYDENGKVYATQTREFTAKDTTHTEEFTFTVPVSFVGNIVYGEDLYHEKRKIATHFDLMNKNQTVKVNEPMIKTMAKVGDGFVLTVGDKVVVTDTLTYSDFKDEDVLIKTWIVKHGTDERVSDVYEHIVRLNGNGEVTVTLDQFDTSKLPAGKYTLMEEVYEVKDGKGTEQLISKHTDNKDEKQSFVVTPKQLPHTGMSTHANYFVGVVFIVISLLLKLMTFPAIRE